MNKIMNFIKSNPAAVQKITLGLLVVVTLAYGFTASELASVKSSEGLPANKGIESECMDAVTAYTKYFNTYAEGKSKVPDISFVVVNCRRMYLEAIKPLQDTINNREKASEEIQSLKKEAAVLRDLAKDQFHEIMKEVRNLKKTIEATK